MTPIGLDSSYEESKVVGVQRFSSLSVVLSAGAQNISEHSDDFSHWKMRRVHILAQKICNIGNPWQPNLQIDLK